MKICCVVVLSAMTVFGTVAFAAQHSSSDDPQGGKVPQFSSRTQLVLVPVTVRDKSGAHISGLTKEDFLLKDNGKEQNVTLFEEIKTTATRSAPPSQAVAVPAGVSSPSSPSSVQYTNVHAAPDRPLLIIAIDRINTSAIDQSRAREQFIKFLAEKYHPGTLVSIVTIDSGGVTIQRDFTEDMSELTATLRRLPSQPGIGQTTDDPLANPVADFAQGAYEAAVQRFLMALNAEQSFEKLNAVTATLEGLRQLARAYAGVPGRKSLIWATAGFQYQITDPKRPLVPAEAAKLSDIQPEYERTWRILADAAIAVYPVDVRGLTNPDVPDASVGSSTIMRMERMGYPTREAQGFDFRESIATMQVVADATGGRAFFNTNDLALSFERAAEDSSAYYMLGFYLHRDMKPGWRSLKVQVRGAAQVRTRSGYFVAENNPKQKSAPNADIALAINSPLDYEALPLTVRWLGRAANTSGQWEVNFEISIAPGLLTVDEADANHVSFHVVAVGRSLLMKLSSQLDRSIEARLKDADLARYRTTGLHYRDTMTFSPGKHAVRILVRDNISGKIGTVTLPLELN